MEGRFGFPRPFGDILKEYRPLIPSGFRDAPSNIGVIATKIDNDRLGDRVNISQVEGNYFIDFTVNIRGIDEMSKSSLAFTPEGNFLGGLIRMSSFKGDGDEEVKEEISSMWRDYLTDEIGLKEVEDELDVFIRVDRSESDDERRYTPHVIFTSKDPSSDNPSPLTTPEIMTVLDRMVDEWPWRFAKYSTSGRVMKGRGDEGEVETKGSVSDMLDRFD